MTSHNPYKSLVVHCQNSLYDVYIGGATPCAPIRPHKIPQNPYAHPNELWCKPEAVEAYERWILLSEDSDYLIWGLKYLLKNKVLGCWCKPRREHCWGDVMAKIANESDADTQKRRIQLRALEAFRNTVRPVSNSTDEAFRNSLIRLAQSTSSFSSDITPLREQFMAETGAVDTNAGCSVMQSIENTHDHVDEDGDLDMMDIDIKPAEHHRIVSVR